MRFVRFAEVLRKKIRKVLRVPHVERSSVVIAKDAQNTWLRLRAPVLLAVSWLVLTLGNILLSAAAGVVPAESAIFSR